MAIECPRFTRSLEGGSPLNTARRHLGSTERTSFKFASDWCSSAQLTVIIPCYNEAPTVVELLRRVRRALPASQIIFVDDGSTDGSDALMRSVAEELCIESISLPKNSGKGAAFRAGLELAEREYTIPQDADLEYDPRDIQRLLKHAINMDMDAVYGSRYLESGCKGAWANYIAVKLLGLAVRLRFGQAMTDPCTCYKLFRTKLLRTYSLRSAGFELCQEMNSHLLTEPAASFVEVPVSYVSRSIELGKKIRVTDFATSLWKLLPSLHLRPGHNRLLVLFAFAAMLQSACTPQIALVDSQQIGISAHGKPVSSVGYDAGVILGHRENVVCFPLAEIGINSFSQVKSIETSCACVSAKCVEYQDPKGRELAAVELRFEPDFDRRNPAVDLCVELSVHRVGGSTTLCKVSFVYVSGYLH